MSRLASLALPSPAPFAVFAVFAVFVGFASGGCTALATTPGWIGGGMAVESPVRVAAAEAKEESERKATAGQPTQVGAKHLLVMHDDSSAKPDTLHRTREEARKRAQEALLKIRGGADFGEMVKQYTDEPGGSERGGDLGVFERALMVKPFSDAAFALKVGEVSEVVETKYGFHVIKRTE